MATVLQPSDDLVTFEIKIGGAQIPDIVEVQEIQLDMEINRISSATLVIMDGGAIGSGEEAFGNSEGKLFVPGQEIEITLGYDNSRKTAFKGVVVAQRLRVRNGSSQLIIRCKDKAFGMTKGRSNAIFHNKTDSEAIKSIASNYSGISLKLDQTTEKIPTNMQYNCSDWDFVVMRAEANNMVVTTHQNNLNIQKIDFSKKADFEINAAQFVIEIDLNLTNEDLVSEVGITAWDSHSQKEQTVTVALSDGLAQGNLSANKIAMQVGTKAAAISSSAPLTEAEMKLMGASIISKSVMAKIEGSITVPGTTAILAGDIITLSGFSKRYNGKAYITRVSHEVADGAWITTLTVGAPKRFHASIPDVMSAPASGILPAANGLQIATVKKIIEDPFNNFRVLISLPSFSGPGLVDGVWARLAVPYATENAGFFFFPEIGDEVIVSFLNNDPRFPVITGSLYSSKRPPAETPEEGNRYKSIRTSSGIQIRFDDEDKILDIQTPAGNSIRLDDAEQSIVINDMHQNSLTMNEDGLSLVSVKDISLSAQGDIKLDATGEMVLEAKGDLTATGANVDLQASMSFKAEGGASAELSSAAQTTVKGAIVQIN